MKITKSQLKKIIKEELENEAKCERLNRDWWTANYEARGPADQSMVVNVKSSAMEQIEAEMQALGCPDIDPMG